tara:strand:- start:6528 stop:8774 length:2247 start_codon:yes stop_codon:yes gene_type:complete
MNIYSNISLFFLLICASLPAQNLELKLDGETWWQEFQKSHQVHLYNAPYSLKSDEPKFAWKPVGDKGSLLFDGYSTYMEIEGYQIPSQFDLSFYIAPRAFDSAVDNKLSAIIDYRSGKDSLGFKVGLLKHGQLAVQYGEGNDQKRLTNDRLFLEKNQWNFVNVKQGEKNLQVLLNGNEVLNEPVGSSLVEKQFQGNGYILTIGRNANASGFGRKFRFNMISGLLDEISIGPLRDLHNDQAVFDAHGPEGLKKALRLDPDVFDDEFRPNYHAIAPAHWMNEPHAPMFYNGKYHLFYQHNPFGPYWGQIHWGHWVSDDMVNWKHADIALAPEKGTLDPDGIWSGSAYVGPEDTPMLFYTAGNDAKAENQYTAIAVPEDKSDKNLISWTKTGIIVDKPAEYLHNEFRDPFVFQIDGTYFMIVGSGIENKGGTAVLFESQDAKNWNYLHPFYQTNIEKYPYLGGVWELPILLPLPTKEGKITNKYAFMVLPIRDAADVDVFYWVGSFDKKSKKFVPDHEAPLLLDYGNFGFTGQSGFVDPKTGRSIVFSIAQGKFGRVDTYDMGWAHNAGLPINIWLGNNNELNFSPIEELSTLREKPLMDCNDCRISTLNEELKDIKGDQLEIDLDFIPSAGKKGIIVRKSKTGNPQAMIYYDPSIKAVVFDKTQENPERKFIPLKAPIGEQEEIRLRIFLDKSMIEIYINDKASITDRIYFNDLDAQHLELMGFEEDERLDKLAIYPMQSINWEYVETSK